MSVTARQIPATWENLTFDQAIQPVTDEGKRVDRSDYLSEGSLPVIDQGEEFIGGYTNDISKRYNGPLPVIVFGDHTRRVKLIDFPFVVGAQGVKLLKPKDGWEPRFLAYLLPTLPLPDRGYGRHYQYLRQLRFLRPPKSTQREIVAEIEKQFTRLEAGVVGLRRVQANLKRYRAAVLKAACEGKLVTTEAELARQEGRTYETGAQLLERILTERRLKWNGKTKYKELVKPDAVNLPPVPEGWVWATIDGLLREPLRNGHSAKASGTGRGLRAFTLTAVTDGDFSERNTKLTVADPAKVSELWAEAGDIYIERSNTPEFVGIARLYRGPRNFAFIPDLLIRVRLVPTLSERFVEICLLSSDARDYFRARAQGISGSMPKIDQSTIESAPIPLPPVSEQQRIVAEVERRLSVVEELEAVVNANQQRVTRLRQSILQRAFEGELLTRSTTMLNNEPRKEA